MPRGNALFGPTALAALLALGGIGQARAADESVAADEALVEQAKVKPDGPGLLDFFRKRTPSDPGRLKTLVHQLGSPAFRVRSRAGRELTRWGTAALPFLKAAADDPDAEVRRAAAQCAAGIARVSGPELPAAAARLLARRNPPGAVAALLNYLPYAEDDWLQEEVSTCLGLVGLHDGKADRVLTAALTDRHPERRGAAAYVLGRMGGLGQRPAVRRLLDDPDQAVRRRAAEGLVGKEVYQTAAESAAADEALFQEERKEAATAKAVLAFFRQRTLGEAERRHFEDLVRRLGSRKFAERSSARRELTRLAAPALPFLRPALDNPDREVAATAERIMQKIEQGPVTALPVAAAHLLQRLAPPGAVEALLAYVPYTDNDQVFEEVLNALCALSARAAKVNPALSAALGDELPARRAAAAFVLARVGTRSDCRPARRLLDDPHPRVRFRAAQGFLAAQDQAAVPVLVDLLREPSDPALRLQAEEALARVAGDQAPTLSVATAAPADLPRVHAAWARWWASHQGRTDLTRAAHTSPFRNLRLISEFDLNGAMNGGKVWECGRDGKARWQIGNLMGPIDAHVLPNGRVLVAENYGRRVVEYDHQGKRHWEKTVNGNPVACQRLPNGNTFVACYYNLIEVRKDGTEVYNYSRGQNAFVFSACKKRNGNILCMNSQGTVTELDSRTGKELKTFTLAGLGNWCSVEELRNGRYLIALMSQGKVLEVDGAGKEGWNCTAVGAHTATRLPNGHTLVACMNNRKVAEYDRTGKEVWSLSTAGRPFRIRYR